MSTIDGDFWVALDPGTNTKHMCIGREQEYDRDVSDDGGLSGIGPHDGNYLTYCKYCRKPLLWKVVDVEEKEKEYEKK
jgi:hypothetical protein